MSDRIFQANYDTLEAMSARFLEAAHAVSSTRRSLTHSANNLRGAWVGEGADAFFLPDL